MDLIRLYEGKNHPLYVDNFYTTPTFLVSFLLKKGVYCTGTIRTPHKSLMVTQSKGHTGLRLVQNIHSLLHGGRTE